MYTRRAVHIFTLHLIKVDTVCSLHVGPEQTMQHMRLLSFIVCCCIRQPAIMSCPKGPGSPLPKLTSSCLEHHVHDSPNPNTTAPRHLHQPRSLRFSSLLHCGHHHSNQYCTDADTRSRAAGQQGATSQLDTLPPPSAPAPSCCTIAVPHPPPLTLTSSLSSPPRWSVSRPPPASLASSPNQTRPCALLPSSG